MYLRLFVEASDTEHAYYANIKTDQQVLLQVSDELVTKLTGSEIFGSDILSSLVDIVVQVYKIKLLQAPKEEEEK